MVFEQSDINISLLLFCQPFYSVPLRLNTHCSQRDLISVNTIRYRSVKMCLQELYFKKVVAHHDHALVQVPRSVWMYKGCPVSAHAPLVLISCTAEANFPQASECKAAFTLQTKVGKLKLVCMNGIKLNSRQTRFFLTSTVCKRVYRLFLCRSHTPT